jgi:hypothetical protein
MFMLWARLEDQQGEWQLMLEVAERGLDRVRKNDPALLQYAGYAASRLAQNLRASFNATRAAQEFEKSDDFSTQRCVKERRNESSGTSSLGRTAHGSSTPRFREATLRSADA